MYSARRVNYRFQKNSLILSRSNVHTEIWVVRKFWINKTLQKKVKLVLSLQYFPARELRVGTAKPFLIGPRVGPQKA